MCGGEWRNSVYEAHTSNWERAGYDDTMWEAAKSIGANGVSPWYKRPGISYDADWIWTPDENAHDHVFCRKTQSNTEVNRPRRRLSIGRTPMSAIATSRGNTSRMRARPGTPVAFGACNSCSAMEQGDALLPKHGRQHCRPAQLRSVLHFTSCENPSCEQHECTDKCRGIHIASRPLSWAHRSRGTTPATTAWDLWITSTRPETP